MSPAWNAIWLNHFKHFLVLLVAVVIIIFVCTAIFISLSYNYSIPRKSCNLNFALLLFQLIIAANITRRFFLIHGARRTLLTTSNIGLDAQTILVFDWIWTLITISVFVKRGVFLVGLKLLKWRNQSSVLVLLILGPFSLLNGRVLPLAKHIVRKILSKRILRSLSFELQRQEWRILSTETKWFIWL